MSPWLVFAVGVVAGFAIANLLTTDTACCATVRRAVDAKLGPFAGVADALGLTVPLGNALG